MSNVMVALPNIGGDLCSTPQSSALHVGSQEPKPTQTKETAHTVKEKQNIFATFASVYNTLNRNVIS